VNFVNENGYDWFFLDGNCWQVTIVTVSLQIVSIWKT